MRVHKEHLSMTNKVICFFAESGGLDLVARGGGCSVPIAGEASLFAPKLILLPPKVANRASARTSAAVPLFMRYLFPKDIADKNASPPAHRKDE
jgi:hypothetical protein